MKDDLKDHDFRLKALENVEVGSNENVTLERFQQIEHKLGELERVLHTKVDCELYDEEILNIKNMIAALNTEDPNKQAVVQQMVVSSGPSISTKDLVRFREAANKVTELEEMLNKLMKYDLTTI